ncbi:MAG: hypothetical protein JXR97_00940 [Planctomycetes bacterium]|nr:hypothetical protein [Planctomycetota bacterium]
MSAPETTPTVMAIFGQREEIPGDDALLALARERLLDAGLGAEFYPGSTAHLQSLLNYRPGEAVCTAHLPRSLNILEEEDRRQITEYASLAAGQLSGFIIHDRPAFTHEPSATQAALESMNKTLADIPEAPRLFVENSGQLAFAETEELAQMILPMNNIGICLDISHLAIQFCHTRLSELGITTDARSLLADREQLIEIMPHIQRVTAEARAESLALIGRVVRREQPIHFHIHDGHPLSTLSLYGVNDHLSFLQQICLPFEWEGRRIVSGCYSVDGLRQFAETVAAAAPLERCSFMLEIHPQPGRLPLGEHANLFAHWQDLRNAEQAKAWHNTLIQNATILRSFLSSVA